MKVMTNASNDTDYRYADEATIRVDHNEFHTLMNALEISLRGLAIRDDSDMFSLVADLWSELRRVEVEMTCP